MDLALSGGYVGSLAGNGTPQPMKSKFDAAEHVKRLGESLVRACEDARQATAPGEVGNAIEHPIRRRLEQVLPRGIGVGAGFVIDSEGGTSRQMDVVLYEKELCPAFCINEADGTTYYPCEGVIAVGEVKSAVGKRELSDAFAKIKSVKELQRDYPQPRDGLYVGRRYGAHSPLTAAPSFHRDRTNKGDIYGFILAAKPSMSVPSSASPAHQARVRRRGTLLGHYVDNVEATGNDVLCPDLTVFLDGTVLTSYVAGGGGRYTPARQRNVLPHSIHTLHCESPLAVLIQETHHVYQNWLTADIPMARYLRLRQELVTMWAAIAHVPNAIKPDSRQIETPVDHVKERFYPIDKRLL